MQYLGGGGVLVGAGLMGTSVAAAAALAIFEVRYLLRLYWQQLASLLREQL